MKLNDIKSDLVKQYYLAMFIGSDKSGLYSEIEKKKALEWLTKLMLDKKKSKVLLENIKSQNVKQRKLM